MDATPTHLHELDRVQRTALHPMVPGVILQNLGARRDVYALTFLYKLIYREEPLQLLAILPHRQDLTLDPRTRSQHHQSYEHQELARNAANFLKRSFPHGIISAWSSLLRSSSPWYQRPSRFSHSRGMCVANCLSATDSL